MSEATGALVQDEIPAGVEDQPSGDSQAEPSPQTAEPELATGTEDVPSDHAVLTADQPSEPEPSAEQPPAEQQQEQAAAEGDPGEDQAAAVAEQRPATGQAEPELLASDPAQSTHKGQGGPEPTRTAVPEHEPAEELMTGRPEDQQPAAFPAAEELPLDPTMLPTLSSSGLSIRQYLDTTVVPVLRLGLRELVKARPTDPFDFLADYIRDNKPK